MKRVIIVHGWGGNPDEPAMVWLANQLKSMGLEVLRPTMPNPENPEIQAWVAHLKDVVAVPDADTFFVGHSIGCQTVLRYLQTIDTQVGGAVFIAGWFSLTPTALETDEDKDIAKPWLETSIDFSKVKLNLLKSTAVFSEDDPLVPIENAEKFKSSIGSTTIILTGKGHFSESDGVSELPEVLGEVLKVVNS